MSTATTVIATATAVSLAAGITTTSASALDVATPPTVTTTTASPQPTTTTSSVQPTIETESIETESAEETDSTAQAQPADVYLSDLQKIFADPHLGTIQVEETVETTKNTITLTIPNAQPSQLVWVSAYLDGKTYTPAFEKWVQVNEDGKVVLDARELAGIGTYVLAVRTRWEVLGYGTYTYSTIPFLLGVWSTVIEHMEDLRDRIDLIEKILTALGIIPQPKSGEQTTSPTTSPSVAAAPSTIVIEEYVDESTPTRASTTYLYSNKPTTDPAQPVDKLWELGGANKGNIELTIDNTTAHLALPSGNTGDWYYLWLYSSAGAQPGGWTQIGEDKTLALDISALPDGTYKFAVQDSAGNLVGWVPLTMTSENSATTTHTSTPVRTVVHQEAPLMTARDWVWITSSLLLVTLLANAAGIAQRKRTTRTLTERTPS